jgi:hypothetical protein
MMFILGGGIIIFNVRKRQILNTFLTTSFLMFISFLITIKVVLPEMNHFKSAKPFCKRITRYLSEGKEIASYRVKTPPFNFYTGLNKIKKIPTSEELINYLDSPSTGLIIIKEEVFNQLQEKSLVPIDIHIVDKAKIGHRAFLLLFKRGKKGERRSDLISRRG